jgi:8-amino-7-oxononanoate synthase
MMLLDFTSSLYLGFGHTTQSLRPWSQLTTGVPVALDEPRIATRVAIQVAELQDCEKAVLGPSTLHLFWDWFGVISSERVAIYLDAGTYPVIRWGVERAKGLGVPVQEFAHRDIDGLRRLLSSSRKRRPIVVSDGMCTACGCATPVDVYLESVRSFGGLLVIDDTQALGMLGAFPEDRMPLGWGGGGSLRYQNISGPDVVVISSLAKAFGAPLAALCGSKAMVEHFENRSETRMHSSPPSIANIHAAERALKLNAEIGDRLRLRLMRRVQFFRDGLAALGLEVAGGIFPVQTLETLPGANMIRLYQHLLNNGIRTILRKDCNGQAPRISFVINAQHQFEEISHAIDVLAKAI